MPGSVPQTMSARLISSAGRDGILINSDDNMIGGVDRADHNIVNLNGSAGIEITYGRTGNQVYNAWIGTGSNGKQHQGNVGAGVSIHGTGNTVLESVIAYNHGNGIEVLDGTSNALRLSRIYANGKMAIDLGGDGVTPNDSVGLDFDTGPNDLQNAPVIRRADHLTSIVRGKLVSTPNSTFTIEIWSSPVCDNAKHGEARVGLAGAAADPWLTLLGSMIDTTPIPESGFRDRSGTIGRSTFFAGLGTGAKVTLQGRIVGTQVVWTAARRAG